MGVFVGLSVRGCLWPSLGHAQVFSCGGRSLRKDGTHNSRSALVVAHDVVLPDEYDQICVDAERASTQAWRSTNTAPGIEPATKEACMGATAQSVP